LGINSKNDPPVGIISKYDPPVGIFIIEYCIITLPWEKPIIYYIIERYIIELEPKILG
jgi:hypothetical protein